MEGFEFFDNFCWFSFLYQAHFNVRGLIQRQISPFELKVVSPLAKMPHNLMHTVLSPSHFMSNPFFLLTVSMEQQIKNQHAFTTIPMAIGLVAIVKWAHYANDQSHREHWD